MKRKVLVLTIALALTFALAAVMTGCGDEEKDAEKETKKITMCLDWTPNTNHSGIYAALNKGYFKDEGLDVKVVQPPENGAASMVASGKAEFGVDAQDTTAPAIIGKDKLPITTVAAILQHNTSGIVSLKEKGITSPGKMEGHTYATWDNPVEQAMLKQLVTEDGGDFSKVKMIPSNVTDEVSAFKKDQVDSIWIFYGWAGIACKQAGLDINYWDFKDLNKTFDYYTPTIVANNEFLEKDAETAKAFMKALSKGYTFAAENPDEAADILIAENEELKDSADLVKESQKYISKKYIDDADKWGVIDADRWNGFYQWLNDNKLVEEKLEKDAGFTNDYLPE